MRLNQLHWRDWQSLLLYRQFSLYLCLLPLLCSLTTGLVLLLSGYAWKYIQLGMVCAGSWNFITSLLLGISIDLAKAAIAGFWGGLLVGLLLCGLNTGLMTVLWAALFMLGVFVSLLLSRRQFVCMLFSWKLGIGFVIALSVFSLIYILVNAGLGQFSWDGINLRLWLIALLISFGAGAYRSKYFWFWASISAVLPGLILALFFLQAYWIKPSLPLAVQWFFTDAILSASLVILVGSVFLAAYLPAYYFVNQQLGLIAGGLSLYSLYCFIYWEQPVWMLLLGLLAWGLGLAQAWWRPVLSYPLQGLWHLVLLHIEHYRYRQGLAPAYLYWHSAFWDKRQFLPWLDLVQHLRLLKQYAPMQLPLYLEKLACTQQAWIVGRLSLLEDMANLEAVSDMRQLSQVHQQLSYTEGIAIEASIIRRFKLISQDVAAALEQNSLYNQRLMLTDIEERLDHLILEISQHPKRVAKPFQIILAQWHDKIFKENKEISIQSYQQQEIYNPYVVGVPLTTKQEIFIGRDDIMHRIEHVLLARQAPPILLYGQRRMGKTSLLNNLRRLLSSHFCFVYVDFQSPRLLTNQAEQILSGLVQVINRSLDLQYPEKVCPSLDSDTSQDTLVTFDNWLDQMADYLGDQVLLLALDEFVTLEERVQSGHLAAHELNTVLGIFRHIVQHRPCFRLLLSGSHQLDELHGWAGYFINVQVITVAYLDKAEALKLITAPVSGYKLRYTDDALVYILKLTHCHPALVQLLCNELVELKNTQPAKVRHLVCFEDVEATVPLALSAGSFYFNDMIYNQIDKHDLLLLNAIAAVGESAWQQVDMQQHQTRLQHLLQRDLIQASPRQAGYYQVHIELLRQAVCMSQTLA
ncbi:AAA family ATPase [Candidatus Venteria ishoeyi]|uniref:AAA family ATPase n=1 Tax=Candidatus Venteria ishoeyi TaxID=1899563 RepID=UPI0025A58989|nr:AAA family ATPase [Candidatus Venteria ishoeyi]MDM8547411.1 AAA family ATPase [Candidatus Venteria ishoeyi]